MYQAFDINLCQFDKKAKACDCGNNTCEVFADFIQHIFAFQPTGDIAGGIIGAAFVGGAMFS
jgi:hypothetical protein